MAKTKKLKTEYEKYTAMLAQYEKILHPDLFNPIMTQLNEVYNELKTEAYQAARISQEALAIEKLLKELKAKMRQHDADGTPMATFFYKIFYKQVRKIFDIKNYNNDV